MTSTLLSTFLTAPKSTRAHTHDLAALKDRVLIPQAWQALGLPGNATPRCRSPFRPDRTPSFSIYDGGRRWKDFATGAHGDVIDFIATARQVDAREATRLFLELAGVPPTPAPAPARKTAPTQMQMQPQGQAQVRVPRDTGTEAQRQQVADTRHLSPEAVSLALALHTLTFGTVRGHPCWILTDTEGRIAEARRVDGLPFPAEGATLAERKAHTLPGSRKSWPVGAAVLRRIPTFRTILLVEGGPDYLAALHFAAEFGRWDVLPVAMLGRGATRIDPAAVALMRGLRVRIYAHRDADGGGLASAHAWARQLADEGACRVDIYQFDDELQRTDGRPVKDLNDCTHGLTPESTEILRQGLIPETTGTHSGMSCH